MYIFVLANQYRRCRRPWWVINMADLNWPIRSVGSSRVDDVTDTRRPLIVWTKSESQIAPWPPIQISWVSTEDRGIFETWTSKKLGIVHIYSPQFTTRGDFVYSLFLFRITWNISSSRLLFLLTGGAIDCFPHFVFTFSELCQLPHGLGPLKSLGVQHTSTPTSRSAQCTHGVPSPCNSDNGGSTPGLRVFHPKGLSLGVFSCPVPRG